MSAFVVMKGNADTANVSARVKKRATDARKKDNLSRREEHKKTLHFYERINLYLLEPSINSVIDRFIIFSISTPRRNYIKLQIIRNYISINYI